MIIETFVLGDLQTNCYLVYDEEDEKNQAIIIDPADDGDFLNEELVRRGLNLKYVVLTHGHFDHCLGLLSLKTAWPQSKILMNFADQFLLKNAQTSALHWLQRSVDPVPPAEQDLKEGDLIELGQIKLKVIETPGHTPGSICLLNEKEKILFAGDTLFENGIGRTDFSYSNFKDMQESLAKLEEMRQAGIYGEIYSGHGSRFFR
jgi:glyoxylase-like metal-dependent hydrolase (beta-lactamase superfamily II)